MSLPLIHVGYHKTASSWLQQQFFPSLGDAVRLYGHEILWGRLMAPVGLEFDPRTCGDFLAELVAEAAAFGATPVFSSERLSGNPHSGGYDAGELAQRLYGCLPEARILVVIREQRAMVLSNYKQYIRMGGTCTLEEYLSPPVDGRIPLFRLGNFRYHHLVHRYRELFGSERVLVLPYEMLRQSPQQFLHQLLEFMQLERNQLDEAMLDTRVNVSMNDLQVVLKRWANKLSGDDSLHPVRPLAPGLAAASFRLIDRLAEFPTAQRYQAGFARRVEAAVGGFYSDSNRELESLLGLDLQGLGYLTS